MGGVRVVSFLLVCSVWSCWLGNGFRVAFVVLLLLRVLVFIGLDCCFWWGVQICDWFGCYFSGHFCGFGLLPLPLWGVYGSVLA